MQEATLTIVCLIFIWIGHDNLSTFITQIRPPLYMSFLPNKQVVIVPIIKKIKSLCNIVFLKPITITPFPFFLLYFFILFYHPTKKDNIELKNYNSMSSIFKRWNGFIYWFHYKIQKIKKYFYSILFQSNSFHPIRF